MAGGGGGAVAVTAGPGAAAAKEEAAAVKEEEKKVENFGHSLEWSHASFCTVNGSFCSGSVCTRLDPPAVYSSNLWCY
jgi:hypothetical protein